LNNKILKNAMDGVLQMLYPRRCPVCDCVLTETSFKEIVPRVCPECENKLVYVGKNHCFKCGKTLKSDQEELCYDCKNREHFFEQGYALFEYASINASIYRFKYKGRCEYADFYGKEMEEHLGTLIREWNAQALVPVPMHRRKERIRGYNQARCLAEGIAKYTKIPVYHSLVERTRKTTPMKELDVRERQNNLKKAFHIMQDDVKLKKIVIVDDIYTTGSTVDAIAKELKNAGVQEVFFLALAIGTGL